MKIFIDPYRGGLNTGKKINNQYEKDILLNLSKYMKEKLNKLGIPAELIRDNDITLTDEERNSIINELKNTNDIIIQNRISSDNEFDIIYPLRNNDKLPSIITTNLQNNNINVDKYYQRRLPSNPNLDYYSITRNTSPNETIIIEYLNTSNYEHIIDIIANSIKEYIDNNRIYIVKSGDTLYQIANKYKVTVNELKSINNLKTNTLKIGEKLKIPNTEIQESINQKTYTVKLGDTLYQIAKKNYTTIEEIKKINNLQNNDLKLNQILILPQDNQVEVEEYIDYIVQKGDTLYQIANKYNITVNELKKINNLDKELININQKIKVPIIKENYSIYTIIKGDSLYKIAKQYNTTVSEIKSLNNLENNNLSIGQKIKIPR